MALQTQQLYESVAKEFVELLAAEIGSDLDFVVLYGSVARIDANSESDIDILIVAENKKFVYDRACEIRSSLDLTYETFTTLILYTPEQWQRSLDLGSPFLESILEEGRPLYGSKQFKSYQRALQIS